MYEYADGAALFLTHNDYEYVAYILEENIKMIMNWFDKNYIFVNHEKTNFMCFRNPHKEVTLTKQISIDYQV